MAEFTVYNIKGEKVGTMEQPALFQTPLDEKLVHRYYIWVRTMLRPTLAHTKTRGEVRGGGRKPWKQKGTGRARVGSSRSPIWRTGGIVFGPRNTQNWETRMPRSERRKALFSAFASKAQGNTIFVLDEWTVKVPKTKEVASLIQALPIVDKKKVLHIHATFDNLLFKATNNIPGVTSKTIANTNIVDILNHDTLILTKETVQQLEQHFTPSV